MMLTRAPEDPLVHVMVSGWLRVMVAGTAGRLVQFIFAVRETEAVNAPTSLPPVPVKV